MAVHAFVQGPLRKDSDRYCRNKRTQCGVVTNRAALERQNVSAEFPRPEAVLGPTEPKRASRRSGRRRSFDMPRESPYYDNATHVVQSGEAS